MKIISNDCLHSPTKDKTCQPETSRANLSLVKKKTFTVSISRASLINMLLLWLFYRSPRDSEGGTILGSDSSKFFLFTFPFHASSYDGEVLASQDLHSNQGFHLQMLSRAWLLLVSRIQSSRVRCGIRLSFIGNHHLSLCFVSFQRFLWKTFHV